MKTLSELKDEIRSEASKNPEKFFATEVLREKGFERQRCSNCGLYFWSRENLEVCGEPECGDGYTFIGDSPTSESYSYVETWQKFRDFMQSRGYTPINRYPVVARWRNDVEFVGGSIYNFQPHVVSGEAEPPAEELIVPQPSLRFNDIGNVGVTGRHYVLHNHIGQTCFREGDEYDQDRYFRDMFEFTVDELGVPAEKLVLHEDAWGGGGNLGACMEFFVDGLELFNQVYMFYSQEEDGYSELDLKVLDMGMGHERITWISHGTETSYECVMPGVLDKMKDRTGLEINSTIWERFLPYSGTLNVDEVDDIEERWQEIADEMELDVDKLKSEIRPAADLYAVAEHSRALLFALVDGKLPSNTGGGHNLRVIYRRSRDFIRRHGWELEISDICRWHARELKPMFPELEEGLDEVEEILEVEKERYERARERAEEELSGVEDPSIEKMIELYESHGVSPEMMEDAGIEVPDDFYARVSDQEETVKGGEDRFNLESDVETRKLYYEDETRTRCTAKVEQTLVNGWIVLDQTVFYPEGGGQMPDTGTISHDGTDYTVEDVQKQSGAVLHHIPGHSLEEGDGVTLEVDEKRRTQLMKHHTATHLVNLAARELFGEHVWQAGSRKTREKARLDVTHYRKFDRDDLDRIENRVRDLVRENHPVEKEVLEKSEAEQMYGFRLYQGGAVPGGEVRVVSIDEVDHEACGGTHLSETSEVGEFVVTGSRKVQDGVVRLEYLAGPAAEKYLGEVEERIETVAELVGVDQMEMMREDRREVQRELCSILSVEPENLEDSVERFIQENQEMKESIDRLSDFLDVEAGKEEMKPGTLVEQVSSLFQAWKENEKTVDSLEGMLEDHVKQRLDERTVRCRVPTENIGLLIQIARKLSKDYSASITLVGDKGAVSASFHEDFDARDNLEEEGFEEVEGGENFAKAFS